MSSPPATPGAVFLSYAREDAAAARRIADALRAFGVEVWFDQSELRGGDAWDQKIRKQIKDCALFVPIISANTNARAEGYFRREWRWAVDRMHDLADDHPFLLPVIVDHTPEAAARVPERFRERQWTRLPAGNTDAVFCRRVLALLEGDDSGLGRPFLPKENRREEPLGRLARSGRPSRKVAPRHWVLGICAAALIAAAVLLRPQGEAKQTGRESGHARDTPSPGGTASSNSSAKSIAVLPFANLSEERDSAFFTDGIQEDILTNLAHVRELRVVSRTSVAEYRATTKKVRQIAEELGVTYILEGSVRRSGNKVRVTGQLIRAATDEHIWAETLDRDLNDVFAIQSELARKIASSLEAALSPREQTLLDRRPTTSLPAYDAFLRGRALAGGRRTPALFQKQEELFQQAVTLDPNFAAAWGELAMIHALSYASGYDTSVGRLARSDAALAEAVKLAADAPEILHLAGMQALTAHRDFDAAKARFEKLAELQPNDPSVYFSLAQIQQATDPAAAVTFLRQATRLDPGNVQYSTALATRLTHGRRWAEAIVAARRVLELRPADLSAAFRLAVLPFKARGDRREAMALFAGLTPSQANSPEGLFNRKLWAFSTGDLAEYTRLDRILPDLPDFVTEQANPEQGAYALMSAAVLLAAGDTTAARSRIAGLPPQMREQIQREPANAQAWTTIGVAEALLDHPGPAREAARRATELSAEMSFTAMNRVIVEAWVGDKDWALTELARLLRTSSNTIFTAGTASVFELKVNPFFAPLRDDPRFQALLDDPKNREAVF